MNFKEKKDFHLFFSLKFLKPNYSAVLSKKDILEMHLCLEKKKSIKNLDQIHCLIFSSFTDKILFFLPLLSLITKFCEIIPANFREIFVASRQKSRPGTAQRTELCQGRSQSVGTLIATLNYSYCGDLHKISHDSLLFSHNRVLELFSLCAFPPRLCCQFDTEPVSALCNISHSSHSPIFQ